MIEELAVSTAWLAKEGEDIDIYRTRIEMQRQTWRDAVRHKGQLYLIKFNDFDIRPMWEEQIDAEKLRGEVYSPLSMPLDCPLCQPYDHFDISINAYAERRYLTKIVNQRYPEGFIDKEGVWVKCACILKGEARKWLKFKNMTKEKT